MTDLSTSTTTGLTNAIPEILRSGGGWPSTSSSSSAVIITPHTNGSTIASSSTSANLPSNLSSSANPLSAISLRSSLLGVALGLSTSLTTHLIIQGNPLWRAPFFIASLSIFHFLEFYMTALYNTPLAKPESFLLTQNGAAYNAANMLALLETVVVHWSGLGLGYWWSSGFLIALGLGIMVVGQSARSVAMAHAGTSFNHTVQKFRVRGHVLVTRGIYAWLRHPSYFGFFWWALGTQLVLGNVFCLIGYSVVLWKFFMLRIKEEEKYLDQFFGEDYERYKRRTSVGIPFVS